MDKDRELLGGVLVGLYDDEEDGIKYPQNSSDLSSQSISPLHLKSIGIQVPLPHVNSVFKIINMCKYLKDYHAKK